MSDLKTFVDIFHTTLEIFTIFGGIISAGLAWYRKKTAKEGWIIPIPYPKDGKRDFFLMLLYAIVIIFFSSGLLIFLSAEYFPNFVITSPYNGQTVISDVREVEIGGIGAHPGETVTLIVSDGHTQFRQLDMGIPSEKGNWVVQKVVLQTPNYEYSIWAETKKNGTVVLTENHIKVKRVDNSQWLGAFVHNNTLFLGILGVIVASAGVYAFYHFYKKRK